MTSLMGWGITARNAKEYFLNHKNVGQKKIIQRNSYKMGEYAMSRSRFHRKKAVV